MQLHICRMLRIEMISMMGFRWVSFDEKTRKNTILLRQDAMSLARLIDLALARSLFIRKDCCIPKLSTATY